MANVHAAERKVNVIFNTFHHAQNMRREIRALCLRRFTYKFKAKSYETPEQIEARKAFEEREIDKEIDYVINILRSISMHIRYANAIHPMIWAEYSERRLHQTLALADCSRLSAEIQFVIEDYGTDVNQFIPIDKLIQGQISLIRAWRQSDNKIVSKLKDKPNAE